MPKYYCDYCDTFLTHDSPSVRKTHNGGRKHKENVRMYYQRWMDEQAQKLVDKTTREFTQQQRLIPRPAMPTMAPGFPYPIMPGGRPAGLPIGLPPMPTLPPSSYPAPPPGFPGGVIPAMPPYPGPE